MSRDPFNRYKDPFCRHLAVLWNHRYLDDDSIRRHMKAHSKDVLTELSDIFYLAVKHGRTFRAEMLNIQETLRTIEHEAAK